MPNSAIPRIAIVGTGEIGQGWAALAVAAGWPVSIYDADSHALQAAAAAIPKRVEGLVRLGRAEQALALTAIEDLRVGRSLLHAVGDADWIIEAAPEDLALKQRLLEQIEQVSRLASVLTSSASGLHASALCGRLRRPERFLVTHPLNPVELIPVIEVIPGPLTHPDCTEDIRYWLDELGRVPIVLRKEIEGNAVGRVAAAVWRECIHLVLEDVVDVRDIDRLVTLGPALGWAAAGPHLTCHLAAGGQGVGAFVAHLLRTYETWWGSLATWQQLDAETQARLVRAIEGSYDGRIEEMRRERDAHIATILNALEHRR